MRQLLFALAVCAISFCVPNVCADDLEKPSEPTIVVKKSWYGWQTLTCDGAALTFFVVGGETASHGDPPLWMAPTWAISGASVFLLGGPLVHLAHGHPLRALGDFGMRAAMSTAVPLLILAGPASIKTTGPDGGEDAGLYAGLAVLLAVFGAAGAVAIDATRMSREEKRVVVEDHASRSFSISPDFSMRRGGGTLGLRGSF